MKERPIIFNAEMVRAILDGRKTQTRKIIKFPIGWDYDENEFRKGIVKCPYGQPGDRLWVRETFRVRHFGSVKHCDYKSDGGPDKFSGKLKWRHPAHMLRWASRITLEITDVRVERLQEISEEEAQKEGTILPLQNTSIAGAFKSHKRQFAVLWNSLNKTHRWQDNPWVWVIMFKRLTPNSGG